jgi:hypothetical protein
VVFTVSDSPFAQGFLPKLISIKGMSEGAWELQVPAWRGESDRWETPINARKRPRTDSEPAADVIDLLA